MKSGSSQGAVREQEGRNYNCAGSVTDAIGNSKHPNVDLQKSKKDGGKSAVMKSNSSPNRNLLREKQDI